MTTHSARNPELVNPLALSKAVTEAYRNVSIGDVNDHEIRMSVMTEQFPWHHHPDSDETFFGVDGELIIDFPDGQLVVRPGDFVTVPAGLVHRTRPAGDRTVNLTFERRGATTILEEWRRIGGDGGIRTLDTVARMTL